MMLDDLAALLRGLADPTRLRVLHLLWRRQERSWPAGELVAVLELPQPTVSRHLKVLREARLVTRTQRGTHRLYALADTQPAAHAAVLGALEAFVAGSPEARGDLARSAPLTPHRDHETRRLDMKPRPADEETRTTDAFRALAHPLRRQVLDVVAARPGASVAEVAEGFAESRVAVTKHLAVLERAGLVHSRRRGRERRLYADPMPLQLAYDRWTTDFTAALGTMMADVKRGAESRMRTEGRAR